MEGSNANRVFLGNGPGVTSRRCSQTSLFQPLIDRTVLKSQYLGGLTFEAGVVLRIIGCFLCMYTCLHGPCGCTSSLAIGPGHGQGSGLSRLRSLETPSSHLIHRFGYSFSLVGILGGLSRLHNLQHNTKRKRVDQPSCLLWDMIC